MTDATRERIAVIVPALNPPATFGSFVRDLVADDWRHIIVVDDGSSPDFRPLFDDVEPLDGVTVLRHEVNRGKGAALKTAYQHCLTHLPTLAGVVTADSDGQHLPRDIAAVGDRLVANVDAGRAATVLGTRDFTRGDIPPKSKFGNRLTSRLVHVLFGVYLRDTQTGLRAFPTSLLPFCLETDGDRFEYEMNVLLHLIHARKPIDEVDIATVYLDATNSETHFRPVTDSARIYKLIFARFGEFLTKPRGR